MTRPLRVVWISVQPAAAEVTIVDVDSDTKWVKFTSLLALFQRRGVEV